MRDNYWLWYHAKAGAPRKRRVHDISRLGDRVQISGLVAWIWIGREAGSLDPWHIEISPGEKPGQAPWERSPPTHCLIARFETDTEAWESVRSTIVEVGLANLQAGLLHRSGEKSTNTPWQRLNLLLKSLFRR